MERIRLYTQRTCISMMIAVLTLFFPAITHAEATPTVSDPTSTSTQSTQTTPVPNTSSQQSTEAAPEQPSGSTSGEKPPTTTTTTTTTTDTPPPTSNTSSQPTNPPTPTTTTTTDTNTTNAGNVTNNVTSASTSGDAEVGDNRVAGNATSGNALVIASLINMLQSQSNVIGGDAHIQTFTANINGDVTGDLFIDPSQLASLQSSLLKSSDIQITDTGSITNNVDLSAISGNATVHDNRVAGDATSGNADAVANIVNMLNSIITAGNSFFGVINIYGNLEGDILLPPDVLQSVLASNSIPTATLSIDTSNLSNAQLTNSDQINNSITTNANTGAATITDNRVGGDAHTGTSKTNITVLNLSSHQVIGSNSLLVFVNVLGQWVGVIMDAPTGSTAAALGGGITQNSTVDTNADINTAHTISNNVLINAQSGNATVDTNRVAGNATSGNATASANVANITNTQFSLSNWFGILFINVFGKWYGSFGVDTSMGGYSTAPPPASPVVAAPAPSAPPQVFQFIPGGPHGSLKLKKINGHSHGSVSSSGTVEASAPSSADTGSKPATLGSSTKKPTSNHPATILQKPVGKDNPSDSTGAWFVTGIGAAVGVSLLLGDRIVMAIRRRRL